jgi:class 3 adenylate cyclase
VKDLQSFYDVLFGNFVVIILIASGITLFSMFNNLSVTVKEMSTGMIRDRLNLTEEELYNIFDPIENHLQTTRSRARSGVLKNLQESELLDAYFLPILKNSTSISSVLIANDEGDEYMLLKQDTILLTRITKNGSLRERPIVYSWTEADGNRVVLDKFQLDQDYDPRTRPWFTLAIDNPADTVISWTDPYTFFTTKESGITASIKWKHPASNVNYVCAIDVLISDLSDFTTSVNVTSNGKVFILSEKLEVIGLPRDERFKDKSKWGEFSLKSLNTLEVPVIDEAVKTYQAEGQKKNYVSFKYGNEVWWAGIDLFPLNAEKNLILGVIVPESDFAQDIKDTRHLLMGGLILTIFFFLIILYSFLKMKRANKIIAIERDKNEQLLLNTLPIKVVNDLKENGKSVPQKFKDVTVCFADIVGFTQISSQLDPKLLINELNDIYTMFDEIMIKYDCERIKTMGDAYLSVCGMPERNDNHAEMMLRAAFEILEYIDQRSKKSKIDWKMRIGMHSGSVVGGIVGIKKYIYDVFGDTINTASRMESYSEPMHVNLSEETFIRVKDTVYVQEKNIRFEKRKPAMVKGKGLMNMYFAHISN